MKSNPLLAWCHRVLIAGCVLLVSSRALAQFAGGSGTAADPYRIATAGQLDAVHNDLNAVYLLVADIDLSGVALAPIGTIDVPFNGAFDGGGHRLSNWSLTTADNYQGLFGAIGATARVENVILVNASLSTTGNGAGTLVGFSYGTVSHCSASGAVNGGCFNLGGLVGLSMGTMRDNTSSVVVTADPTQYAGGVGGMIGSNYGTMVRCSSSGTVTTTAWNSSDTGGLAGTCTTNGSLVACSATGAVYGYRNVGGLVGAAHDCSIYDSSATGNVSADSNAGGLMGVQNRSLIFNSYATGNVTAQSSAGGLVGASYGPMTNCYATGTVTAYYNVGGLVGTASASPDVQAGTPPWTSCYWNTETSGQPSSVMGIGKTTAEMQQQSTFTGWDFTGIWTMTAGSYPTLRPTAGDIDAGPRIVSASPSLTVYEGTTLTLWVSADGPGPFTYQWSKNSIPVVDATAATLTLDPATAGTYSVAVSNGVATINSTPALVTVLPAPAFAGGDGTAAAPYQIATAVQLQGLHSHRNAYFVLTADIDLAGFRFDPVATFGGALDGAGHTIANWSWTVPEAAAGGFVGFIVELNDSGRVTNLTLANATLANRSGYSGLLAGRNNGVIANCTVSGSIATQTGGGLAAVNYGSMIADQANVGLTGLLPASASGPFLGGVVSTNYGLLRDCIATGVVDAGGESSSYAGGLACFNYRTVEHCHAGGTVRGGCAAGLVSEQVGATSSISYSWATATISSVARGAVAGLVGLQQDGAVTNCYARATLTGNVGAGLVWEMVRGQVDRCYAVAAGFNPSGPNSGGLVGGLFGPASVSASYWDTEASGCTHSALGTGRTTAEMQNPDLFAGWDFSAVWLAAAGQYPTLRESIPLTPIVLVPVSSTEVPVGGSLTLAANVSGGGLAYQWTVNGQPIAGATTTTLPLSNLQLSDSGTYVLAASNARGSVTSAGYVRVYEAAAPTIDSQPQSTEAGPGETVGFYLGANGGPTPTYQWAKDGVAIDGATDSFLTLANVSAADAGDYTVIATNPFGSVTSAVAHLTIVNRPILQAINPIEVQSGGPAFSLTVSGLRFAGGCVVQWNGSPRPTTVVDPNTVIASIPASDLVVTGDLTAILITVKNATGDVSLPMALPVISANVTDVQSTTVPPDGSTYASTVPTASGQAGVTTYLDNFGTTPATLSVANYATNPSTVPTFDVGGQFVDVQVVGATASAVATSYFYYPTTITGTTEADLTLLYFDGTSWQPVLSSGGIAPTKDTGDNNDGSVSGGRFAVIFDATSTPKVTELTGTFFTVALPPAVSGKDAKKKPSITTDPVDVTVVAGGTATFNVVAAPGLPVTYQWNVDGKKGPIAGATSATLVLPNVTLADAGDYSVTVTNANGSTTSKKAKLKVLPAPPAITTAPRSQTVASGSDVTFSVTATGDNLTYQWVKGGKQIGGATSATLTLKKVSTADAGDYAVIVANETGTVTSAAATLTVLKK